LNLLTRIPFRWRRRMGTIIRATQDTGHAQGGPPR
jgi:hypothetical protein